MYLLNDDLNNWKFILIADVDFIKDKEEHLTQEWSLKAFGCKDEHFE